MGIIAIEYRDKSDRKYNGFTEEEINNWKVVIDDITDNSWQIRKDRKY